MKNFVTEETSAALKMIASDNCHYIAVVNFLNDNEFASAEKYIIDLVENEMTPGEVGCVDLDAIISTFLGV